MKKPGNILHIVTLAFLALIPAGCNTLGNNEPDWVLNPKTIYPENQFLVAVGSGTTRQSAEYAAAGNLSRIFESRIEADERLIDVVNETEKSLVRSTEMTSDINILSSETLINVQHAEAWKDNLGRYHAVAYINRRETAAIYRDKIETNTRQIQSLLADENQTSNLLRNYAQSRAALKAAQINDTLLHHLKVIHPATATFAQPNYSLSEIHQATVEHAKAIRVAVHLEGDPDHFMTEQVNELATRYGFIIGTPAALNLTGRVTIEDSGKRTAGLAFFRYNLSIQIADAQANVLETINITGREAVTSPDEAATRCHRTLSAALKTQGRQSLDAYFDALAQPHQE